MPVARMIGDNASRCSMTGKIIWHGPAARHRPFRQRLCRPVRARPGRRADQDAGQAAVGGLRRRRPSPMAKSTTRYVCQSCGAALPAGWASAKSCGAWNSIVEEAGREELPKGLSRGKGKRHRVRRARRPGARGAAPRRPACRVRPRHRRRAGARLGDPGRRRSRHRQVDPAAAGRAAVAGGAKPLRSAYISGEEAIEQVRLRAERLGLRSHAGAARRRHQRARHPRQPRPRAIRPTWW